MVTPPLWTLLVPVHWPKPAWTRFNQSRQQSITSRMQSPPRAMQPMHNHASASNNKSLFSVQLVLLKRQKIHFIARHHAYALTCSYAWLSVLPLNSVLCSCDSSLSTSFALPSVASCASLPLFLYQHPLVLHGCASLLWDHFAPTMHVWSCFMYTWSFTLSCSTW